MAIKIQNFVYKVFLLQKSDSEFFLNGILSIDFGMCNITIEHSKYKINHKNAPHYTAMHLCVVFTCRHAAIMYILLRLYCRFQVTVSIL